MITVNKDANRVTIIKTYVGFINHEQYGRIRFEVTIQDADGGPFNKSVKDVFIAGEITDDITEYKKTKNLLIEEMRRLIEDDYFN